MNLNKVFFVKGCSYSQGAGLYYHKWLKDKEDGFKIKPHNHYDWVHHSEMITDDDNKFRRDNSFIGLLSEELGMDFIGGDDVGGGNESIIESAEILFNGSIKRVIKDKVNDRSVEVFLVQLTHASRDFHRPINDEMKEWKDFKEPEVHFDEHLDKLVGRLDVLNEKCKEQNVPFYVMAMLNRMGNKVKEKEYFIPIVYEDNHYTSIEHLKEEKNCKVIKNYEDGKQKIHYYWDMEGKYTTVPLFLCDELYQYGLRDTHLGLNGHKIVKDSIIKKIRGA